MSKNMVKVNGVQITPELANFINSRRDRESFEYYTDTLSDVIDFLIDTMAGCVPPEESLDKMVKTLLLNVKGVKDDMKELSKICETLEIDSRNE